MRTIRELLDEVCYDVGIEPPNGGYFASHEREYREMLSFSRAVAMKVARRYDWRALRRTMNGSFTGAAGQYFTLPDDFDRLQRGTAVKVDDAVLRPLTKGEAGRLDAMPGAAQFYWLEDDGLHIWKTPATGALTVLYMSRDVFSTGDAPTSDTATLKIPDDVFVAAMKAEWRRQKGMDYEGYADEAEAILRQYAADDERSRF